MNETLNTIYRRRAVRKYTSQRVSKKLIEQILDAGRMAPSAINLQPWKFYILTNDGDIKKFSQSIVKGMMKGMLKSGVKHLIKSAFSAFHFPDSLDFIYEEDKVFHGAPVVIFVSADKDNEWSALDIGMCCQNMMLAAKSLGLYSCPIGFAKYINETSLTEELKLPKNEIVHLAVILGYGNEEPAVHERKKDNAIYIG